MGIKDVMDEHHTNEIPQNEEELPSHDDLPLEEMK